MKIEEDIEKTLKTLLEVGDTVILHHSVLETWPDLKGYHTIHSIFKDNGVDYYSLTPVDAVHHRIERVLEHQLIKVHRYYENTRRRRSDAPF